MRRILFATLTFPLLLAGCAVGPEYEEPQVDLPEEWPDEVLLTGEERADWSNWWHRFDDPVLNRLVERALDDNLNMQLQYQRHLGSGELSNKTVLSDRLSQLYTGFRSVHGNRCYRCSTLQQLDMRSLPSPQGILRSTRPAICW